MSRGRSNRSRNQAAAALAAAVALLYGAMMASSAFLGVWSASALAIAVSASGLALRVHRQECGFYVFGLLWSGLLAWSIWAIGDQTGGLSIVEAALSPYGVALILGSSVVGLMTFGITQDVVSALSGRRSRSPLLVGSKNLPV